MTVASTMHGEPQAPELGLMGRVAQSRFGGTLALSAALVSVGIANLSRPTASYAEGSVSLALSIDEANGHDSVTIANEGTECVSEDFQLTTTTTTEGGEATAVTGDSTTLEPGRKAHVSIESITAGGDASLNIYHCNDIDQTKPLTPPDIFAFQQGYSVDMKSGQSSPSPGSFSGDESCIVPETFADETIVDATSSLAQADCQPATEYQPTLTKRQTADHLQYSVGGFVMMTSGSAPAGQKGATILRTVQPGQVLPSGINLYSLDELGSA